MTADLSQDDRGKTVVYQSNRIGTVSDVRGGTAYVDPDMDHVPDQLRDVLGWSDEEYTLDEDRITDVSNGQVTLRDDVM